MTNNQSMKNFESLTKYIEPFSKAISLGEWEVSDGAVMPYVSWSRIYLNFQEDFYKFVDNHPKYEFKNYKTILEEKGLYEKLAVKEIEVRLINDEQTILLMIITIIRQDRFITGLLKEYLDDGLIVEWLERLRELDNGPKGFK